MWKVEMFFVEEGYSRADASAWYEYGVYSDRHKANEVALQVRRERGCEVRVLEV